jgi:chromosome segregation ATPase
MAELGDLVSLLQAITTDEAKAKRLAELQAKYAEIETAIERDEKLVTEAHAVATEAATLHAQVAATAQANADRAAALDQREAEMGRVLKAMNEEKAIFEAIRKTVENEQSDRRLQLETTASTLNSMERELHERMDKTESDAKEAAFLRVKYEGMVGAIVSLLHAQGAL